MARIRLEARETREVVIEGEGTEVEEGWRIALAPKTTPNFFSSYDWRPASKTMQEIADGLNALPPGTTITFGARLEFFRIATSSGKDWAGALGGTYSTQEVARLMYLDRADTPTILYRRATA